MVVLYSNRYFSVVNDGAPGLKIWDRLLDRRARDTGGFYDRMGAPYPDDALTAAIDCADRMATILEKT